MSHPMDTVGMEQTPATVKETTEEQQERCYTRYYSGGPLAFCPLKDLNLPANYEEVVDRFRKLQGERAVEVLN